MLSSSFSVTRLECMPYDFIVSITFALSNDDSRKSRNVIIGFMRK